MVKIEALNTQIHDRKNFICNEHRILQDFFQQKANQEMAHNLSKCYVAVDDQESPPLLGYYTLSSSSVPKDIAKSFENIGLVTYNDVPVILLGRLAVDSRHQGKRIGSRLLFDAIQRVYNTSSAVGTKGLVVDAKDDRSENFFLKFGFTKSKLTDSRRLFMPIQSIQNIITS